MKMRRNVDGEGWEIMRGNISDIRQYLKDREALQAMEKELEERMEPEAEPSEKQSPEVPDLDEIIWFFGEEYTVDSQSLEIILRNYTRGMAEQVQSDEAGEDPFFCSCTAFSASAF